MLNGDMSGVRCCQSVCISKYDFEFKMKRNYKMYIRYTYIRICIIFYYMYWILVVLQVAQLFSKTWLPLTVPSNGLTLHNVLFEVFLYQDCKRCIYPLMNLQRLWKLSMPNRKHSKKLVDSLNNLDLSASDVCLPLVDASNDATPLAEWLAQGNLGQSAIHPWGQFQVLDIDIRHIRHWPVMPDMIPNMIIQKKWWQIHSTHSSATVPIPPLKIDSKPMQLTWILD